MELRLFSIDQAPRDLPVWELIINDLGRPSAKRVARALGVGVSTVYRWNLDGHAPRMACLALFWLTRWGRSEVNARATNDAILTAQLLRSLNEERSMLRARADTLAGERDRLRSLLSQAALRLAHRGSGATASATHTDTAPDDWQAAAWTAVTGLLAPQHARPARPAEPTQRPLALPPIPDLADVDRGSPAAPPPAAHSARCPAAPRTDQPRPSAHPGSESSSPCAPLCNQSDAILASDSNEPFPLLELRQAQGREAQPHAPGEASVTAPAEALPLRGSGPGRRRELRPACAPGTAAEADQGAATVPRSGELELANDAASMPLQPGRLALRAESQQRGLNGPSHGAAPHTPAPRAPEACAVDAFAAITSALTTRRPR